MSAPERRVLGRVGKAVEYICVLLLGAVIGLSFFQVLVRYFFHFSIEWVEEVARLCFVWVVFLGAALAIDRGSHPQIDLVQRRAPATAGKAMQGLVRLLLVGFSTIMLVYGARFYLATSHDYQTSLGYPRNLFYLPIPLSGLLMIAYLLGDLLGNFRARRRQRG